MGRLIDADALIEEMKKEQESGKYDENTIIVSDCFIRILNGQPTAYDVEKVVAELEDKKIIYFDGLKSEGTNIRVNEAIDIVKRGGIDGKI